MTTEPDRLEALKPCLFAEMVSWLEACLTCDQFVWDGDQYIAARDCLDRARHRIETNSRTGDTVGERANLIARIEYILDMTASAKERLHRRAHLTNHDLRMCIAALSASQSITPPEGAVEAALTQALRSALRFAGSRSAITSQQEQDILAIWSIHHGH